MIRTRSLRLALITATILIGTVGGAEDKKEARPALSGVWAQKGGLKITFEKESLKISPHGDNEVVVLVCSYSLEKGGLVKARLTDIEGTEEVKAKVKELIPDGLEFTFKWQAKDGTATLEDVEGEKTDAIKARLEGEYRAKKND